MDTSIPMLPDGVVRALELISTSRIEHPFYRFIPPIRFWETLSLCDGVQTILNFQHVGSLVGNVVPADVEEIPEG